MSLLKQIVDGCLLSRDRLMRAREFYSPSAPGPSVQDAFAHWTQRVSVKSEVEAARELAGLSDAELAQLEAEFQRCPMRQQSAAVRQAVLAGLALVMVAGLGLALLASTNLGEIATRILQAVGVGGLLLGLIPLGVGLIAAFSTLHLDLSHGATGLQVGTLNDQHPWLYKATNLTVHPVAQDYRQRTLLQRGPLRGADYVLMRELVRAQEALERVRPARSVADELQQFPKEAQAPVHEPRLVRVASTVRRRASGKDAEDGLSRVAEN